METNVVKIIDEQIKIIKKDANLLPQNKVYKIEALEELRTIVSRIELPVSAENGGLSNETLKELGFIKIPDGMYYERGWEHKEINIAFDKRPTKVEFWTFIANEFSKRGEDKLRKSMRNLLKW